MRFPESTGELCAGVHSLLVVKISIPSACAFAVNLAVKSAVLEDVDRGARDRWTERRDQDPERQHGRADAKQGRAPATSDADREHDRQRLDHLDRARQERGGDKEGVGQE